MKYLCFSFLFFFLACKSDQSSSSKLGEMSLLQYGLPIKILAPENPEVTSEDLGFVQDVTVKGEDNYYLQILGGTATTNDVSVIKAKQMEDLKATPYFSKIVEEDDAGFIFEKEYSPERINYDFRYIKIQADKEYVFQTGLIGSFTLEEVKRMYDSIK